MDRQEIEKRFTYHAPFGDQVARYRQIRESALFFADQIISLTPGSHEQSLAITALEECVMRANSAIACNEIDQAPASQPEIIKIIDLGNVGEPDLNTMMGNAWAKVDQALASQSDQVKVPFSDLAIILRINEYIQHQGHIYLDGHSVNAVALDHSCTFNDFALTEVQLTDAQLLHLFLQTQGCRPYKTITDTSNAKATYAATPAEASDPMLHSEIEIVMGHAPGAHSFTATLPLNTFDHSVPED